jgi:hypothetical protein
METTVPVRRVMTGRRNGSRGGRTRNRTEGIGEEIAGTGNVLSEGRGNLREAGTGIETAKMIEMMSQTGGGIDWTLGETHPSKTWR